MLILAGVSLNAIVGDNGIISNAQNASILSSIAALEEFFQNKYVELYAIKEDEMTPLETLMTNNPEYFCRTSEGYVLDSQNHQLYLIQKKSLPNEIKNSLKGGDGDSRFNYYNQIDVYGITTDLKVYYCSNGIESILGISQNELDSDAPDKEEYSEDDLLAKIINGEGIDGKALGNLTTKDLKKITSLTIDTEEKVALLSEISKLPNLNKIIFKNLEHLDTSAIKENINVGEVRFESCSVNNYIGLRSFKFLNKLYLVAPEGLNQDVINLGQAFKEFDFVNLEYFGITGCDRYIQSTETVYSTGDYFNGYSIAARHYITSISPMEYFTQTTKDKIKFLYLNNLDLTTITSLMEFKNVIVLRLDYNSLYTLDGIDKMTNLAFLSVGYQRTSYFGINDGAVPGYDLTEENAVNPDALKAIANCHNLTYIYLTDNAKFKWIKYLNSCTILEELYLSGCTSILDLGEIAGVIGKCTTASYPGSMAKSLISNEIKILDISSTQITKSDFENLKGDNNSNNTVLEALNLNNTQIYKSISEDGNTVVELTDDEYNTMMTDVLGKCTAMKYLRLDGQTQLDNINFVTNMSGLLDLHLLRCTGVSDLSILETQTINNKLHLRTLVLNNPSIDLTDIQTTISNLGEDFFYTGFNDLESHRGYAFWYSKSAITNNDSITGLILGNNNLYSQLEECTNLTRLCMHKGWRGYVAGCSVNVNLSNCSELESFTIYSNGSGIFTLPSSIKNLSVLCMDSSCTPDVHLCNKIEKIYSFACGGELGFWNLINQLPDNLSTVKFVEWRAQNEGQNLPENYIYEVGDETRIINHPLKKFANCKDLETFVVRQNNDFSDWETTDISGITDLTYVKKIEILFNGKIHGEYTVPDLSGLINLEQLSFAKGRGADLTNVKTAKNLKELIVNDLPTVTNTSFLTGLDKIEVLDLQNNDIRDLRGMETLTNLRVCYLNNNSITDVYPLKNLNNLKELHLENNKLSDFGYNSTSSYYTQTVFSDMNENHNLSKLYLQGNLMENFEILQDGLTWEELVISE